ncbi:alpha-2-macroglobulin-like protein 1 [Spea bombifrons]|uniref:alpha-2-macroglobulin-like protein 1 n=1 Tax=Spea bombifrons TaxID=233779 RepID=UPI00234B209C|nr:alpha-2-macroglobulin-like protein 1 [Spea bombifrons]
MQLLLAFTCLAVLGSAVAESSEPHYLVTIPDSLHFGSTQKACLAIQHLKGPANLKLQLEDPETQEIKLEVKDKIDGHDYSHCYELQVPKIDGWRHQWNFNVLIDGENFHVNDSKKVRVYPQNHGTFIHLDKPMYKPGQTVSFRLVSLDLKLRAVNEKIPLVEILDPKENRIAQWKDVSPIQGFVDLSFPLADEIPLGDYQIRVNKHESKSFSVSEYVLKKFDLKVNLPKKVTPKDESFVLEVCGSYTFGKPVHGSLDIYVCEYPTNPLEQHEEDTSACQHIHGAQTDNKGCFTTKVDLGFFNLTVTTYIRRLTVAAALKEHITGLVEKGEAELEIGTLELISFVDFETFYFRGLPFTGMMKVTDTSNQPSKKQTVYLIVNNDDVKTNISLVTDEKGIAHFTLDTSEWKDMVVISGAFSLEDTDNEHEEFFDSHAFSYRWLKPFYSDSNSYLKVETLAEKWPCDKEQPIKVEYHINKNELDPDSNHLSFFYIVRGREGINYFGEHKEEIKVQDNDHTLHGSFSLKFAVNNDLYPTAQVLVFTVLRSGGMAGDKSLYRIPACFKSKVQLEFSEKVVEPRGKVNLEIRGEPGSFCSVRSVDKGLLHHRAHEPTLPILDEDLFQNNFIYVALYSGYIEDDTCPGSHSDDSVSYQQEADVYQLFMTSGLMVFSNAKIKKPVVCNTTEFTARSSAGGLPAIKDSAKKQEAKKPVVRSWFPETWLYDLVSIGPDSKATLKLTTPDSITNWATDAFCFGESGYGEAKEVDLTVLKSYFIDLTLPHSAVQGETFPVTAVAHNYLDSCIVVAASLSESSDFKAEAVTKEDFRCICADQSAGFTWNITASKIGYLKLKVNSGALKVDGDCAGHHERLENEHLQDFLEKTIRIKPSGVEEDHTETYRMCPKGESVRQEVSLKIPENAVKGSEHAYITVFGDLINIEDFDLERLVNLPTGCGEQNMATFAANLYAMELINNTRHLTPKEEKTFLHSLTTGYQKQLHFKNEIGSYSIFASDPGDVWLTAFVIRGFGNARKYIYIDENNVQDSLKWLSSLQKPDGCFEASTGYFNNRLEDEENHELAITAYIAISLMEYGLAHNTMLDNALSYLRNHADKTNHTYTEALLAYAFSLSGDNNLKQHILEDLETKAIKEGVLKHWDLPYAYSGVVETSACVLLSLLTGHPNEKDLNEASKIANWIARQQKAQGSYYSTQDTVAAFHALSKFTAGVHVEIDKVSVTVRSLSGFQTQLDVDKSRTDLQQKVSLPDIPGEYTVTAVGSGCVYVQTHLTYHAPPAKDQKFFVLSVKTRPAVCTYQEHESFDIMVEVSYSGNRVSSNMVIVEVELLTGFVPDKRSVALLIQNQHVKKTEITEEKVIIYLGELTHETQSLSFKIKEETHVDNLHPAAVLVYDYYEPEESAAVEYNSPCSSDPGHCNAEVSARKDCGHPGITQEECLQKHCCYDTSVPDAKWCFYRTGHAGTR